LIDPKNASAAFNLGLLREAQKMPREAAAAYRKALQIKPNDGTCHANLCSVLRKVGDLEGAIAECRQAVRLLPESAVVLTNLGLLLSDQKQFDEAREQLHRATQKDAKFAPAWTGLGRVELRRKQAAAAVDALAKATKLEPKDSGIAADFCRALVEKDMRAKATEEECRRAIALDGQNGLGHYELVKILVARGDCAGAKSEVGKLGAIELAKGQAKAQAEEIVKTCVPGRAVKGKKN
jgi:Tfp pilus assembly protein PilF